LIRDVLSVSSGTIAGLINDSRYSAIDTVWHDFVEWINQEARKDSYFKKWGQAWGAYWAQCPLDILAIGYAIDENGNRFHFQASAIMAEDETETDTFNLAYTKATSSDPALPPPDKITGFDQMAMAKKIAPSNPWHSRRE